MFDKPTTINYNILCKFIENKVVLLYNIVDFVVEGRVDITYKKQQEYVLLYKEERRRNMETIAAISTPPGVGGIGIIRISGDNALNVAKRIFKAKNKSEIKPFTIRFGYVVDENQNALDQVLVSYFKSPKSYTGEDVLEITCHGGNVSTREILELVLKNGARLAEPGEFTKRAFLNGKLDLTQAEAVIELINSKSDKESKASYKQLEGLLGAKIKEIKQGIIDLLVDIEANIDYPEYDIEEVRRERIYNVLSTNVSKLETLEKSFESGKILRDGVSTVIIGKPNVGKSSLLNRLVKEDRAIVTEIAGTTRDTIEEYITIRGIPLKLVDTAGIHETDDIVESIGVNKSKKAIDESELVLLMLDATRELSKEDEELLEATKNKNRIILINKIDADKKINKNMFKSDKVIEMSTKTLAGIEELEETIEEMFNISELNMENEIVITNVRHKNLIHKAAEEIKNAIISIKNGLPIDMLSIDLQEALQNLGEITGESISEEVVKGIFAKFCVGK